MGLDARWINPQNPGVEGEGVARLAEGPALDVCVCERETQEGRGVGE